MKQRHFLISVMEWGHDRTAKKWREVERIRQMAKKGWRLPTREDFADAKSSGLKGFVEPSNEYWASGNGDALAITPNTPKNSYVCNRYNVAHRLRLVRRVDVYTTSSNVKPGVLGVKLPRQ